MKLKTLMIIIIAFVVLLLAALVIGRVKLSIEFGKEIKLLFSSSKNASQKTFQHAQLAGLPEPVQRYFNLILKDGQPYINCARITHDGQFKTGLEKDWVNIKGEQYATTEKPGFIWKGTTSMFTARDMYIADKGRLVVSVFSMYNIVDASGKQYDQGELLRWLGESILYPTNLLPGERLQWTAIDSHTAKLTFNYNSQSLYFNITFNEVGEITEMETKRYMDKDNLETWVIRSANYTEMENILVPTTFEVLWRLKKGDFSYAKFNMRKIEYNNPERY